MVPWMWTGAVLSLICVVCLLVPRIREREGALALIAVAVIVAVWIEKGMGMIVTGFVPSPLGEVSTYTPTLSEIAITVGVYAMGFMILTLLCGIVVNVRKRLTTEIG